MDDNFWDKFKLAVKENRENVEKISYRKAAKQIGISPSTLYRIESGLMPDTNTFIKVFNWINKKNKSDSYIDFSIPYNFNQEEEETMYKIIELINEHINNLKFDGVFSKLEKYFFYILIESVQIILLIEVCKRLELYGKWETCLISLNNNYYPYNKNAICIRREEFNPKNIIK